MMESFSTMTTLSTATAVPFAANRTLRRLCLAFALWLLYTSLRPEVAFDYWLENALTIAFAAILAATYRRLALSDLSYSLIFAFLVLHEWGAQYKYSDVPLGEWMKPVLGVTRNHYDRVMHFAYGLLLAYPMQEWFVRSAGVRGGFRYFLPVQFTLACSAVYEMLEAFMATILSAQRGEEFVGMQGDIWDAQQDMFLATLGALLAMAAVSLLRHRKHVDAAQPYSPMTLESRRYTRL
jgi:putative membrane protein